MDNNNLLMIVLAFVVGYCLPSMMNNMCGGRLLEGTPALGSSKSIMNKFHEYHKLAQQQINDDYKKQRDEIIKNYPCDEEKLQERITKCTKDTLDDDVKNDVTKCETCLETNNDPNYNRDITTNECDINGMQLQAMGSGISTGLVIRSPERSTLDTYPDVTELCKKFN
jgi:hypothetical protein